MAAAPELSTRQPKSKGHKQDQQQQQHTREREGDILKKPKVKPPKLPFQAQTMGGYQQKIAVGSMRKDAAMAVKNTSMVTVFKPDADGNLVAVETVGAVFVRPTKRTKPPKQDRSLL